MTGSKRVHWAHANATSSRRMLERRSAFLMDPRSSFASRTEGQASSRPQLLLPSSMGVRQRTTAKRGANLRKLIWTPLNSTGATTTHLGERRWLCEEALEQGGCHA